MSMVSEASQRQKQDGYDVIGAIEDLKQTSEALTVKMAHLETAINKLGNTIVNLNTHYQKDFVDYMQADADRINRHTLELLRSVEKAAEELDAESIDSLKERLVEMSRATMRKTERTLKEVEKSHEQAISRSYTTGLRSYTIMVVILALIVGLVVVLGDYIIHGAELIFENDAACIWLVVVLLGLFVWGIIYTITHKNK